MALEHYRLDEGEEYVIQFSGGRSSAFMLRRILDAHDGALPENARVCFQNTGKEKEETLEFIQTCGIQWNVEITWLEYEYRPEAAGGIKDPKHCHRVVNFESASRNGEPFWSIITAKRMLPNPVTRFCTEVLKIETANRWLRRDLGLDPKVVLAVLGIRYDEPKRWSKALLEECKTVYPMAMAGVTLAEVTRFWQESPFDLAIPSGAGNCDLCFLKGRDKLVWLIRQEPRMADWWVAVEEHVQRLPGRRNKADPVTFKKNRSYASLVEAAADPTEQLTMFGPSWEPDISCYCGDE